MVPTLERITQVLRNENEILKKSLKNYLEKEKTTGYKKMTLQKYLTIFHAHFIAWLATMQNSCITPKGIYAATDNLQLEIVENHPGMLMSFMSQIEVYSDYNIYRNKDFCDILQEINIIFTKCLEQKNGFPASHVIYTLEETSALFIPWIEKIAIEFGAKDLIYTEKHGEADILHASLGLEATASELHNFMSRDNSYEFIDEIRNMNSLMCRLLHVVFG